MPPPPITNTVPPDHGKARYLPAVIALVCIAVLLGWSLWDASFPAAMWVAKVNLGIEQIEVADPSADLLFDLSRRVTSSMNRWERLGKRVAALYLLYGLGLLASVVLLVKTMRGRQKWLVVTSCVVTSCWAAFFTSRSAVEDWRCTSQIIAKMDRFERVAATLSASWPNESGIIEPIGKCVFSPSYPGRLLRYLEDPYPMQEDIGMEIVRDDDGVIRFFLAAASGAIVEYHPTETEPTAFDSGFDHWQIKIVSTTQLKPHWYLVRFSQTLRDTP